MVVLMCHALANAYFGRHGCKTCAAFRVARRRASASNGDRSSHEQYSIYEAVANNGYWWRRGCLLACVFVRATLGLPQANNHLSYRCSGLSGCLSVNAPGASKMSHNDYLD